MTAPGALGRPRSGPAASGGVTASVIASCRDDGPLASRIGEVVQGHLMPLLPVLAGLTVTAVLAALGVHNLPGVLLLAPAIVMLLAALGAGHPHDGRSDWLVPPLLQAGQYVYLAAAGFALGVPPPATFALIGVIALHYTDLLHRSRYGIPPGRRMRAAGLGWEGRMLVAGAGALVGIETFTYIALAGYLAVIFGWDSLTRWLAVRDGTAAR